jgi:predicted amidophosphoribosyltransferase
MAASSTSTTPLIQNLLGLLPLHWLAAPPRLAPDLLAELAPGGIHGLSPIPWWAAGLYQDRLRRQLLQLRKAPQRPLVGALIQNLAAGLQAEPWTRPPLLVPIPSWKKRANPLPGLLTRSLAWQLGWRPAQLLQRSRPVLGQHHLGRDLRWANQAGAFRAGPSPERWGNSRPPVLLIDDILTTGATAYAAATALREQGWRVVGMACLGRTPPQGRDLGSPCRSGDGPG